VCLTALFFVTVTLLAGNHLSGDVRGKYDAARIAARAVKSASEVGTRTNVPYHPRWWLFAGPYPLSRRGAGVNARPIRLARETTHW